ncbi:MAG: ketopantoate reductase family protein [Dissulfurimicrobium sp.]|uniref:ketopantoate reductase family protein n=1 Tax=Dissulfurimicrobium TaxID=1769732 RepID=UPI001EDC40E8|nr:2-dehydropantoate 2-reductase [Dissulfurimicrobium hydrothermale]UKL13367.1 2-dehydropantoate 2-reductase [Dissulfurimicrobium hydrothermale]
MRERPKLTIIGPGAIGCLIAGYIERLGQPVSILDYKGDRAERLSKTGIEIDAGRTRFKVYPHITADAATLGVQDWVLILVKANQTDKALKEAKPLIGAETIVISLQNGIGQEEAILRAVRPECIALGITAQGATLIKEGCVKHLGTGDTKIGLLKPCDWAKAKVDLFADTLSRAGWSCSVPDDITPYIWRKFLANVGINAITALTGIKNGEILGFADAKKLQELAVAEAWRVAVKKGIKIDLNLHEAISLVRSVCERTSENISSMLQDRIFQRPTEIDYINGAVVKMGLELGVETPINEVLNMLVKINSIKGWETVKPD